MAPCPGSPHVAQIGHGLSPMRTVVLQLDVEVRVYTLPCGVEKPGSHVDFGAPHEYVGQVNLVVTVLGGAVVGGHVTTGG